MEEQCNSQIMPGDPTRDTAVCRIVKPRSSLVQFRVSYDTGLRETRKHVLQFIRRKVIFVHQLEIGQPSPKVGHDFLRFDPSSHRYAPLHCPEAHREWRQRHSKAGPGFAGNVEIYLIGFGPLMLTRF